MIESAGDLRLEVFSGSDPHVVVLVAFDIVIHVR
jgi:hypothetical protein